METRRVSKGALRSIIHLPRRTLERIAGRVPVPEPASDRLYRRRDRKQRTRRITAAVLAIAITLLSIPVLVRAFGGIEHPARPPNGIFSGLGGWIAYGFQPGEGLVGIFAVDPLQIENTVQLSTRGGQPLAWSSDGSKLLIQSDIPGGKGASTLWVLGADGSQTTLLRADGDHWIGGASFTPGGSDVVYAYCTRTRVRWGSSRSTRAGARRVCSARVFPRPTGTGSG